jgi:hypothetical protein
VEPQFPFEFVVYGTPVSHQGRKAAAREEWKELVAKTCEAAWQLRLSQEVVGYRLGPHWTLLPRS